MDIAIVHYHLNPGGVTQVILNQLAALASSADRGPVERILVLYGGRKDGWPDPSPSWFTELGAELVPVEGLDYEDHDTPRPAELARAIRHVLTSHELDLNSTILHVHNPGLGKNLSLTPALSLLAADGAAVLVQIHDFAEDFRPENYRRTATALQGQGTQTVPATNYPQSSRIHYSVLNGRDFQVLTRAGVDPSRLHLLPNPVADPGQLPDPSAAREKLLPALGLSQDTRLLVYPVRGIRRKNLGEALLWSAIAADDCQIAITLAPRNPVEQVSYERWVRVAADERLPCIFELGARSDASFPEVLAAADMLMTTSVAEGFGMVFLEAPLNGRDLIGRDLPEITTDFVSSGMQFQRLKPHLLVPVSWVGEQDYFRALSTNFLKVLDDYGLAHPSDREMQVQVDQLIENGLVDFGTLTLDLQELALRKVVGSENDRDELLAANPWMTECLTSAPNETSVARNREIVNEFFSPAASSRRLQQVYESVSASPSSSGTAEPLVGENHILSEFVNLGRFHPLRVET